MQVRGAAARPGLVRPSPVSAEPAVRRQHPLVAARRPADRRADPRRCGRSSAAPAAERWAVAIAPLLPYLLLLFSLALTARRLIAPRAYPLAFLALFFAGSTNGMFMPERIDHHGWQLALLALGIAGDRRPEARPRRADARHLQRAVAGDRARDADLSRARRGRDGAVLGRRRRRARAAARLCRVARRRRPRSRFLLFASYDNRQRGLRRACRRSGCPTRCSAAR